MSKSLEIALNALPILLMLGLVPLVSNDLWLTAVYLVAIVIALAIKRDQVDIVALTFGFAVMTVIEYLFVSTGVEVFKRNSLFGVMPLWLPFLWAYSFVTIKRVVEILKR